MTITPARLQRASDGGAGFSPAASDAPALDAHDYVQEEWTATGTEDGNPYATTICVRRPRDAARFSGTVIAETLHVHGITPVWLYTGEYICRSGHAWVEITAQKTTLDMHVRPTNPDRYADLHIEGPDTAEFDAELRLSDPEHTANFWSSLRRHNRATNEILAQVGAALRTADGPLAGFDVREIILAGHSQTGSVASYYIEDVHDAARLPDGSPIYDGFFPSGFPYKAFHDVGVPVVQTMSDGDVSVPDFAFLPGYEGRHYRREDSDAGGDRYRLYEIAGLPHMGTRVPPFDDAALWRGVMAAQGEDLDLGERMNSLPHFELFSMTLDHLVRWVAEGAVPPRADRIELAPDGYFVVDEHGNSVGGVRCVQMDVPHSTYHANPLNPDGTPNPYTVGFDVPFDADTLRALYGDPASYRGRFKSRLDELVADGWLLDADADTTLREAESIEFSTERRQA